MTKKIKYDVPNPFLVYGYHSPAYFCDRIEETEKVISALANGRNITLMAPRRMGKTGLIKNVFYHLNEQGSDVVTIYLDIFSTRNLKEFVELLGKSVFKALADVSDGILKRLGDVISSLRPVISIDTMTGAPTMSLDVKPSSQEQSLQEIFEFIKKSGHKCYIAIDEFQRVASYPETGTEALLRSYIQFVPNAQFIFAGSSQHIMTEMFASAKRPFYQSTQTLSLKPIDEDKYFVFAEKFFKENGGNLNRKTFGELYNICSGQTWYIQSLLNRRYEHYESLENFSEVEVTLQEILNENTDSYEMLTSLLTNGQLSVLKAIAKEDVVKEPTNSEFLRKFHLNAASSVNSAIKALIQKEIVYKTLNGYIVYDRFLSIWLKQKG